MAQSTVVERLGVIAGSVNYRHRPRALAAGIIAAAIRHVDLVGYRAGLTATASGQIPTLMGAVFAPYGNSEVAVPFWRMSDRSRICRKC
jgi:hypothetical protein